MSKKNFTSGLNSLLGEDKEASPIEKQQEQSKFTNNKQADNSEVKEIRATFIVNADILEKLRAIAYWDRVLIKEVINLALEEAVIKYESSNGNIKLIPKK